VPFREVLCQWRRNEQGWLGSHQARPRGSIPITATTPTIGCGISISTLTLAAMAMRRGSTAGRHEPLTTAYDPTRTWATLFVVVQSKYRVPKICYTLPVVPDRDRDHEKA
jgi:hypothetical protein